MPVSEETLDEVETVLEKMAEAWMAATSSRGESLTLSEFGAIAKHHLTTFTLQRSVGALARLRAERGK